MLAKDSKVDLKIGTSLAIGAAMGGVLGKQLFTLIKEMFPDPNKVGGVQAGCLAIITLYTLIYTLNKKNIKTKNFSGIPVCLLIGLTLGIMSSFLGIGGGPINLVVLYYFFSMSTKTAAANSLYIILFSQIASLIVTLGTHTVPKFSFVTLALMVLGGIGGGVMGRVINKKIDDSAVEKLFTVLMGIIIVISIRNLVTYMG